MILPNEFEQEWAIIRSAKAAGLLQRLIVTCKKMRLLPKRGRSTSSLSSVLATKTAFSRDLIEQELILYFLSRIFHR
jgi:hypothetical protein